MQNKNQTTDGFIHHAQRPDNRALSGYVRRTSTYVSTVSGQTNKEPEQVATNNLHNPTSFDFAPVKPAQFVQQPAQQQSEALPNLNYPTENNLPTDLQTFDLNTNFANGSGFNQPMKKANKFNFLKFNKSNVVVGMAIILFITGAVISAVSFKTNKQVVAQVKGESKSLEQDTEGGMTDGIPSEGHPPGVEYYRVPATYPRVIRIKETKTEARVLALSIAKTGALKAPANIFDTGWYKDSAKPGEPGAMIIDGHYYGSTKPAVFQDLDKLVTGNKIEIERGDGKKFNYTVQKVITYDADKLDMSSVMVTSVPGKPGLNLITCAGKFDRKSNLYDKRTVVYAVIE